MSIFRQFIIIDQLLVVQNVTLVRYHDWCFSFKNIFITLKKITNMKRIVLIFSILLINCAAYAQRSQTKSAEEIIPLNYQQDFIYLDISDDEYRYNKNGKTYKTGLFYKKIAKEFKDFPEAYAEYRECRKKTLGSFWASLFRDASSQIAVDRAISSNVNNINPTPTLTPSLDKMAFVEDAMESKAQYHLRKAVFLRNQAIENEQRLDAMMKKKMTD
jgi:hypothetical protein